MADLTPEQAIEKLRTLPEDQQRKVLGALSPEVRKGILGKLNSAPSNPTQGDIYRAKRKAGELPQKEVTSFFSDPQKRLGEIATEAGELSQQYQYEATPATFKEGKQTGERSLLEQAGNAIQSGNFSMIQVGSKLLGGLTDWKTAAAFLVSKLSPAASAAFFATQGARQSYDAVRNGNGSPEDVQNFLLGLSGVAGAMGAGAEGETPGSLKEKAAKGLEKSKNWSRGFMRQRTEATAGVRKAVEEAGEKHASDLEANRAARKSQIQDNILKKREAETKIEQDRLKTAEDAKRIEAENRTQAEQVEQREGLTRTIDEESNQLGEQIRGVEQKVGEEANAKFRRVRERIGNPESDSKPLVDAVKTARTSILQDIPENVKEFNAILKLEGTDEELNALRQDVMTGQGMTGRFEDLPPERQALVNGIAQNYGGVVEEGTPVTWDKLQALKTRLDARMRSRTTPPIIKRALGVVRDSVVDTMGNMAERAGATDLWGEARNFYRGWREDFYEASGPSGSGSPVAQSFNALDPKNIRDPFLAKQATTGNRGVEILRKYPQYGGTDAAAKAESIVRNSQQAKGLPDKVRPQTVPQPKEVHPMPKRTPAPAKLPDKVDVDLEKVAQQKIADTATRIGRLNAWDWRVMIGSPVSMVVGAFLGMPNLMRAGEVGMTFVGSKLLFERALRGERFSNWIAKTPRGELRALQELPNIDKVNVKIGLTDAVIKSGKAAQMSPELKAFLGPENVAKILAASGNRPVQNRREALQAVPRP